MAVITTYEATYNDAYGNLSIVATLSEIYSAKILNSANKRSGNVKKKQYAHLKGLFDKAHITLEIKDLLLYASLYV